MSLVGAALRAPRFGIRRSGHTAALQHALLGLVPLVFCGFLAQHVIASGIGATDFRTDFWVAGHRLLQGHSPYVWTHAQIAASDGFPYPALTAYLFAGFALLPIIPGAVVFTLLCVAGGLGALWLLEVRDWRVFGLTLMSPFFVSGWQTANLTLILVFGLATLWRVRDRAVSAGLMAALLVALKPLMWPIAIWLIATRRYRAALWCAGAALVSNLVLWLLLGFDQIKPFLDLSGAITSALYRSGYGVVSVAAHLGAGRGVGTALEIVLAALALLACFVLGQRESDARAFAACVVLTLLASPLVWVHYFALLMIPMALAWRRIHWAWVLPLALWGCTVRTTQTWQMLLMWAVVGALLAGLTQTGGPELAAGSGQST